MPKPRPPQDIELVLHPERDSTYPHFENAADNPFEAAATHVSRVNAWWLVEAALVTYWDTDDAAERYGRAGLSCERIEHEHTDCYLAVANEFVIVAFRGTEPDQWQDILTDALFALTSWDHGRVHTGFKLAVEKIWPQLSERLGQLANGRRVWFTGHSLGAALATLAADRFAETAGLCTIGSPRVGNRDFAATFNARFGSRSLRYVNNTDIVTHVPPPGFPLGYDHVGELRQIAADGTISTERPRLGHFFSELFGRGQVVLQQIMALENRSLTAAPQFLLDHMPRGYTVDIWNDYEANA